MRSGCLSAVVGVLAMLAWSGVSASAASSPVPVVYVAPVDGFIDLGLAPFVERVLDEAKTAGAAAVVLEINTFGGRVDAAVLIRDALLRAQVKTIAFINRRAISAGALIAETYRESQNGNSVLILTTDADYYRYLKDAASRR